MKNITVILSLVALSFHSSKAQLIYSTKTAEVSFFSFAPIEDIDAHNKNMNFMLNTSTNEIVCVAMIKLFEFKKAKMQMDFNDAYMESDKYIESTFTGKINEKIDYTKDGIYYVTVTGKLKIHGMEQTRTEKGALIVTGEKIALVSTFKVQVKDFNVRIPKLLKWNIAEEVYVSVKADLTLDVRLSRETIETNY